jgi:hypothetical protein
MASWLSPQLRVRSPPRPLTPMHPPMQLLESMSTVAASRVALRHEVLLRVTFCQEVVDLVNVVLLAVVGPAAGEVVGSAGAQASMEVGF